MYKYYKKNEYNVMHYRFDSINEFTEYLTVTPIKKDIFKKPDSIFGSYSFCKTKNFDEAINLLKYGYHEDFDKLIKLKLTLEKYIKLSNKKNRQYNFYVGYAPDVKAYLEGSPLSMINKDINLRKKIDVYINSGYSCGTSANAIFNRGAIILMLIEILESLGFNVDLHLFIMAIEDNDIHFSNFLFKRENERLNPQKLYFPLCHPSWARRLYFRLVEQTPDITESWVTGYGVPCNLKTIEKIIDLKKNDIIIPTIEEINIKGNDIIDDANSLFNYINSLSEKDFELEPIQKIRRL